MLVLLLECQFYFGRLRVWVYFALPDTVVIQVGIPTTTECFTVLFLHKKNYSIVFTTAVQCLCCCAHS